MSTQKHKIEIELQSCKEMLETLNLKNMTKKIQNNSLVYKSLNRLSLQDFKPESALVYIQNRLAKVRIMSGHQIKTFESNLKDQWGNNEFKIFAWICICYEQFHSRTINQFDQKDLKFLKQVFYSKSQELIEYSLMRIVSSNVSFKRWTKEVQEMLIQLVRQRNGKVKSWSQVSFDLFRMSKGKYCFLAHHCRQRWINHLDPSVSKEKWTEEEDRQLLQEVKAFGKKWAMIANYFNGKRTENMVKNRYNALLKKHNTKGSKSSLQKIIKNISSQASLVPQVPSEVQIQLIGENIQNLASKNQIQPQLMDYEQDFLQKDKTHKEKNSLVQSQDKDCVLMEMQEIMEDFKPSFYDLLNYGDQERYLDELLM